MLRNKYSSNLSNDLNKGVKIKEDLEGSRALSIETIKTDESFKTLSEKSKVEEYSIHQSLDSNDDMNYKKGRY